MRILAGALEGDTFIGRKAQEFRGLLKIKYPMEHGIVTDWDDMERIWNWVYTEELGTLSEEVSATPDPAGALTDVPVMLQHPVLLTEAPLNPRSNRDIAAQIFFDTFNVPALFTSVQAVLSLCVRRSLRRSNIHSLISPLTRYSSGRTTGIVLDSGDGVTHAVPVFEGFSMPHAIRRIDVAGRDVTDHLQLLLRKQGHHLHTSAEREVVRTIKEKCCYVAANPAKEEKDTAGRTEEFRLPDGNAIQVCLCSRVNWTCAWFADECPPLK